MIRNVVLLGLFLALPLCGCGGTSGPELGDVSGKVTIDGEPASGVRVSFMPVDGGRPSTATTNADGTYVLAYSANSTGAVVGKHKVSIAPPEPSVDADAAVTSETLEDKSIPQEYLKTQKEVEVTSGSNKIDIAFP